jgi:hypothetical protein
VAYLTDGASEFETLYDQHLKRLLGPDAVSLVDFWHAAEYLGAAARVFEIERKARAGQVRRWPRSSARHTRMRPVRARWTFARCSRGSTPASRHEPRIE